VCHNCGKVGHVAAKCYLKHRKDVRVNKLGRNRRKMLENFGDPVQMILSAIIVGRRECKKPRKRKRFNRVGNAGADGPPNKSNPSIGSLNFIGSGNRMNTECVRLRTDASNERELSLLLDTGADVSLFKPDNLDKSKKFDPGGRVKVKKWMDPSSKLLGP
jgi:hypothetical protein